MAKEAARHTADDINETILTLCQQLIRIDSSNPPGNELEAAKFCKAILDDIGFETQLLHHSDNRASLVAILKGLPAADTYLLVGHLDTVPSGDPANWDYAPFNAEIHEGKIFGRGASDMKGGLTALLHAAGCLRGKKVKNTIILALTADEESGCEGARAIVKLPQVRKAKLTIIPEPTSNDIAIAEKGALWLRITTKGKSAHGSMPDLGINAITEMVKFIDRLDLSAYEAEQHATLGKFTSSIDTINGGIKTNIIPDHCEITIDVRTLPGQDHEEILARIQQLIDKQATQSPNFVCSVETIINKPGIETDPAQADAAGIIKVIKACKPDSQLIGVNYYTDGAVIIPELDIPFLIIGPGDAGQAHSPNEKLDIDKLLQACEIYEKTLNFLAFA